MLMDRCFQVPKTPLPEGEREVRGCTGHTIPRYLPDIQILIAPSASMLFSRGRPDDIFFPTFSFLRPGN